ncbi:ATP-binding cassette domain-containing protein [Cupriavidus pauculus]|uniref:ATP-binding cassette domain-containing protein n=1 Tax=Cupriavidus pauculus TaxID=82633 RepID=A0A5P2H8C8_9BURK|nr:oligopeptide/dipeptide ABC transporter ATP-binding protein [Cupriavidus pauculus]QET04206.1 ATP-binding cassette domain-containing protein [Cupriavidus pauculus]
MTAHPAFLSARDLHKTYQVRNGLLGASRTLHAVSGVGFDVPAGTTFGLVGESGSGKSTLARLLLAAEPATAGTLRVDGAPLSLRGARERKAFHRLVQPVLQDPYASLNPMMRIGDIVAEPMRVHDLYRGKVLQARVGALLAAVGLMPELATRYPNQLSGGQRQRVAIARALGLSPRALVLDEPVSALDVFIQAQILNLLKDIQREQALTYVLISHDLAVVAYMSDQIGVLYLGEFMEIGPRDEILRRPAHPYTRALIAASETRVDSTTAGAPPADIPSPVALPAGCRYQARCPYATARCRQEKPVLREVAGPNASTAAHRVACHVDLTPTTPPRTEVHT